MVTRSLPLGDRLRKLLTVHQFGMTLPELAEADGTPQDLVLSALYRNYGFYIGSWQKMLNGKYRAVWCVVRIPMDAPRPKDAKPLCDFQESIRQKKKQELKKRREKERALRAKVREAEKVKRQAEKLAEKERKAQVKAQQVVIDNDDPSTIKTRWITPPPWTQGART